MKWIIALAAAVGCGSADRGLDLDALSARDVLGVQPQVAMAWDDAQVDQAAEVIAAAAAGELDRDSAPLGYAADPATAVLASVTEIDHRRSIDGLDAMIYAGAEITGGELRRVVVEAASPGGDGGDFEIVASGWSGRLAGLADRDPDHIRAIAVAAGHPVDAPLVIHPAPQEPFAALYISGQSRLLLNPVYLATLEPAAEIEPLANRSGAASRGVIDRVQSTAGGNPYSFFGSIAECAADQRLRCDGCAGTGTCDSVTRDGASGDAECEAFAADNGRGYFLFCANLAAAIATVVDCVADTVPACPINTDAGNLLAALDANAALIDDPMCLEGVDSCLASIYGDPDDDFGGVPDPADPPPPPPPPPRRVEFDCSDNQADCDFSPQIGCSSEGCSAGPSCGGCDGGCEGGGCDSGCDEGNGCDSSCDSGSCEGASCDGCDSNGSGCQTGSCESCDSSEGSGCNGGCDSDSGGCSGGSCEGGSCDSGDCGGGGSCGSGDCGGDCGSSGGGSQCSTAGRRTAASWGAPLLAALFPLLVIGQLRRRERRRRGGRR